MKLFIINYSNDSTEKPECPTHPLKLLVVSFICLTTLIGCAGKQMFPATYATRLTNNGCQQRIYDTDGNGQADYYQQLNESGRVICLSFDLNQDGLIDRQVDLDKLDLDNCRELYILLDGVPYRLIAELYEQGHFRLFHPPSRLISSFPSMTDIAFAEIFGLSPVLAFQAGYYNQEKAKLHDGNMVYLSGKNEPWNDRLDYRCPLWMDAVAYVWPECWLDHELTTMLDRYRQSKKKRFAGYSVSSTCLGTSQAQAGYSQVLLQVEQLCQAAMLASKGRVKITVFADHGHNLIAARSLPLKDLFRESGFRVVSKLTKPSDVVIPEFGLITYASVYTASPERVAAAAVQMEGIGLAMYKDQQGQIVVMDRIGKALISKQRDRYRYQVIHGDPLKLVPVVARLAQDNLADADGYATDADWFVATARHEYPDALARIWRAFHGLVQNTPEVIVTTENGWYCGKGKFDFFVDIASTHGSLNYINSVTFAMSTAGPLPADIRLRDLRSALSRLGLNPP